MAPDWHITTFYLPPNDQREPGERQTQKDLCKELPKKLISILLSDRYKERLFTFVGCWELGATVRFSLSKPLWREANTVDGKQDQWIKTKKKTRTLSAMVWRATQLTHFFWVSGFLCHSHVLTTGRSWSINLAVLSLEGKGLGVVTICISEYYNYHFLNNVEWEILFKVTIGSWDVFPYSTNQQRFIEQY